MKSLRVLIVLIACIAFVAFPARSLAQITVNIITAAPPPELPVYEQPLVPGPNYIWMPGFWSAGPAGYYWVPGTWALAPEPGLLWTPGYWGWNGNGYRWNDGYWADNVGYYGGVNYGSGYYGNGYEGGRWFGPVFRYNSYVSHVNEHIVNVYTDRTVYINRSSNRICYVGGHGGLETRPTAAQIVVAHRRHWEATPAQREHVQVASQNRNYLASVNHGRPANAAYAEPLSSFHQPAHAAAITEHDRNVAHPPQHASAPVEHHAAQPQHASAPVEHHAAQPQHAAAPTQQHAAPPQHASAAVQHAGPPAQHAPPAQQKAAPADHPADSGNAKSGSDKGDHGQH